jgi:hypothetical protein
MRAISFKRGTMRIPQKVGTDNNEIKARNLSFFLVKCFDVEFMIEK